MQAKLFVTLCLVVVAICAFAAQEAQADTCYQCANYNYSNNNCAQCCRNRCGHNYSPSRNNNYNHHHHHNNNNYNNRCVCDNNYQAEILDGQDAGSD